MNKFRESKIKDNLHERNRNRENYDLKAMSSSNPELIEFIKPNKKGEDSIDFSNESAVRTLNKAILNYYYGIKFWEFPKANLCPAIPGRAEYIHAMADLLRENNHGIIPTGKMITGLDIGVGASCIYPIIGVIEYEWDFIGTDISSESIKSAIKIINTNQSLKGKIKCVKQKDPGLIFNGIIREMDRIDLTICNPPFHASATEASKSNTRKLRNLSGQRSSKSKLNFSGINKELVYKGGEWGFISNMIHESKLYKKNCLWFSTLVSKESNLNRIYRQLNKNKVTDTRTINIKTGNKTSRIVAWTYLNNSEKEQWRNSKWKNKA